MRKINVILILLSVATVNCWTDTKRRSFKKEFLFGAASAAFQVEGGWDVEGKGESIWDRYLHQHPELVVDGAAGDVAADSYHHYKRDVEMLRELGADFYRFSISWSRVLPTGFDNKLNEKGLQYYSHLIDELLQYNIQPVVTLFHFDLPQPLQELGGWANPLVTTWFEDYANVVFKAFSNRVQYWITINQPNSICEGYGGNNFAPGVHIKGIADYMCVKNVLVAHARAYRLYETKYKKQYNGKVGISLTLNWIEYASNTTENQKAAEKARAFHIGMYLDPIWSKQGGYPKIVRDAIAKRSKEQGYSRSRLLAFTPEEIKLLKGSTDFIGMNHYTTFLASPNKEAFDSPSFSDDVGVDLTQGAQWVASPVSPWLKSAPYGLYKVLIHLNLNYEYPPVFITEHGWSTAPGLRDQGRVDNLRGYLGALLLALEDGSNVIGYTAWSLMDNVEWTGGTVERFGLYEVDFSSPNKTRTARQSALVYKHIIESRVVEDGWQPANLRIFITDNRKVNTEL